MDNWVVAFWRAMATLFIWVIGGVIIVSTSLFLSPNVGEDSLGAIVMIVIGLIVCSGFIWNWGRLGNQQHSRKEKRAEALENDINQLFDARTKRKNRDISRRLRDYSDEDLLDLRQRVISGEITDSELAELVDKTYQK